MIAEVNQSAVRRQPASHTRGRPPSGAPSSEPAWASKEPAGKLEAKEKLEQKQEESENAASKSAEVEENKPEPKLAAKDAIIQEKGKATKKKTKDDNALLTSAHSIPAPTGNARTEL